MPPIDARKILQDAVAGAPLSLRDDPTAWGPEGSAPASRTDVRDTLAGAAEDNARSALARAFGDASERIATGMDVAVTEDGPLADLDAIWADNVAGDAPDLSSVVEAADWEARVAALRAVMADHVLAVVKTLAPPTDDQVNNLIELDPRLAHLATATAPAFLGIDPADMIDEPAPEDEQIVWDDDQPTREEATDVDHQDEWADAPEPAPVRETGRRGRGKRNGNPVPRLSVALEAAGFMDKEISALLGIDKSYYSQMRSGARPWQGIRDEQAAAIAKEIAGRREALDQAATALMTDEVRYPASA